MSDWFQKSLEEIASALRHGEISAQRLWEAALSNHAHSMKSLGSFQVWNPDAAQCQARAADAAFEAGIDAGPMQGIPISVKDLFGISHYPTFAGSPRELPRSWSREGPVIAEMRRQLAVIAGKTHTVEFAFSGLGANPHYPTPRNPWDSTQHRVPGGSSSGAGVSLCTGTALVALGTDTAGSIRIPASMTGNVGMKTSFGRWSTDGIVPLSPSLDSVGFLTRTVEDAIFVFEALDQRLAAPKAEYTPHYADPKAIRIGICEGLLWTECSPGIAECVLAAIDQLSAHGARRTSLKLPEIEQVLAIFNQGGLAAVELQHFLKTELPEWLPLLDPKIRQRMEHAATLTACEYLERRALFAKLSAKMPEKLQAVDVLLTPTVAVTAPTMVEIEQLEHYRENNLKSLRNTSIVNCLSLCALSLPVGLDAKGIPVGLQLIAPHGQDRTLLAIGRVFEECLGTSRERLGEPPLRLH